MVQAEAYHREDGLPSPCPWDGGVELAELIKDGENGYLCRPCDLAALTTALERVLSGDKEKRRQVARNGANLVRTRHDSRGYADA